MKDVFSRLLSFVISLAFLFNASPACGGIARTPILRASATESLCPRDVFWWHEGDFNRVVLLPLMALALFHPAFAQQETAPKRWNQLRPRERQALAALPNAEMLEADSNYQAALATARSAIAELSDPDDGRRADARGVLTALIRMRDRVLVRIEDTTDNPKNPLVYASRVSPIGALLQGAYNDSTPAPHRRAEILKILAEEDPPRALTMRRDALGYTPSADLFAAAFRFARGTLYPAPPQPGDPEPDLDGDRRQWAALSRSDLRTDPDKDLRAAIAGHSPWSDTVLSVYHLALLGVLQDRLRLYDANGTARLILKIIDASEVDAAYGAAMTWNFKMGPALLDQSTTPSAFVFAGARELAHNWSYAHSAALTADHPSVNAKAIDDFISDVLGLAALEQLGLSLDDVKPLFANTTDAGRAWIAQCLDDAGANPGYWTALFDRIRAQLPTVTPDTPFDRFLAGLRPLASARPAPIVLRRFGV